MNVLEKIISVAKILDEIDDYSSTLSSSLSIVDSKLCDLLHLIENNKLKTNQCYRIIKEIHNLRLERRKIKNDMELLRIFKENKSKLSSLENRPFLLSDVGKENKRQNNAKYNNRIYTEEELKELIGV